MSIHTFSYTVIIRPSTSTFEDDDILWFDVRFKSHTHATVAVPRQEDENRISYRVTDIKYFDSSASVSLHRQDVGSERAVATALAPVLDIVNKLWRAEMAEQLVRKVQYLDRQPNGMSTMFVKFRMKVFTIARPDEEGDIGRNLDNLFEFLTARVKANSSYTVLEPATLSSVRVLGIVPADRLDSIEDRCAICTEEFGIGGWSSEEVVVLEMPCSHKFHRECIIKWLSKNHVCPLCRFRLPHDVMVCYCRIRRDSS